MNISSSSSVTDFRDNEYVILASQIIGYVAGNTCEVNYDDVYKMMQ